ncbi:hypothetical protein V8F06_009277 [Rhypophila decipiens]
MAREGLACVRPQLCKLVRSIDRLDPGSWKHARYPRDAPAWEQFYIEILGRVGCPLDPKWVHVLTLFPDGTGWFTYKFEFYYWVTLLLYYTRKTLTRARLQLVELLKPCSRVFQIVREYVQTLSPDLGDSSPELFEHPNNAGKRNIPKSIPQYPIVFPKLVHLTWAAEAMVDLDSYTRLLYSAPTLNILIFSQTTIGLYPRYHMPAEPTLRSVESMTGKGLAWPFWDPNLPLLARFLTSMIFHNCAIGVAGYPDRIRSDYILSKYLTPCIALQTVIVACCYRNADDDFFYQNRTWMDRDSIYVTKDRRFGPQYLYSGLVPVDVDTYPDGHPTEIEQLPYTREKLSSKKVELHTRIARQDLSAIAKSPSSATLERIYMGVCSDGAWDFDADLDRNQDMIPVTLSPFQNLTRLAIHCWNLYSSDFPHPNNSHEKPLGPSTHSTRWRTMRASILGDIFSAPNKLQILSLVGVDTVCRQRRFRNSLAGSRECAGSGEVAFSEFGTSRACGWEFDSEFGGFGR